MKKIQLALLAVMVCFGLMVFASSSSADAIKAGDLIQVDWGSVHSGNGGEFRITGPYPTPTYAFESFCVEKDEFVNIGGQYTVASISNAADRGGANTNSGDPLDDKTAWLYWMFRTNPSGLGYNNDVESAGALQNVIWYIEEEITSLPSGKASGWHNAATAATATAGGGWTNSGRVAVVNLVDTGYSPNDPGNYYKQDQLMLVPVPEPGILLLLGLGLIGVAGIRRKFKS